MHMFGLRKIIIYVVLVHPVSDYNCHNIFPFFDKIKFNLPFFECAQNSTKFNSCYNGKELIAETISVLSSSNRVH